MIRAQHLRRWLAGLGALSLMATSTLIIASSDAEAADSEHATFNVTCGPLGDHLNITFYTFPAGTIRWNAGTMYPSTVQTNGQPTTVVVGIHPGLNTAAVSWTDANGVAGSASAGATFTAPKCIPPSPYWVGMSSTGSNPGFLAVTSQGPVVAQGVQGSVGGVQAMSLNKPIVGIASLPQGLGYWLVASDGGIFAEGTARFYGSMGGQSLNKPIVGIASTPDGKGYWEVASDGGIFAFGDAQYFGSMGGKPLNQPIVGMAADAATGGATGSSLPTAEIRVQRSVLRQHREHVAQQADHWNGRRGRWFGLSRRGQRRRGVLLQPSLRGERWGQPAHLPGRRHRRLW